jgi:hypothetical protein
MCIHAAVVLFEAEALGLMASFVAETFIFSLSPTFRDNISFSSSRLEESTYHDHFLRREIVVDFKATNSRCSQTIFTSGKVNYLTSRIIHKVALGRAKHCVNSLFPGLLLASAKPIQLTKISEYEASVLTSDISVTRLLKNTGIGR